MDKLDWNHLRAFYATAEFGSLSAAARQLGLTQPTLSRQVHALENRLDVILFERQGRRLLLTHTGRELLVHIKKMQESANNFALGAGGQMHDVEGRVCISAADSIATYVLPKILAKIKAEAPRLTIEVLATNLRSDLHKMEADIAIRHAAPNCSGLVGKHIHDTEAFFYASEEWVRKNGQPTDIADLAAADLIGFDDTESLSKHFRLLGIPANPDDFRLISSSAVVIWEMVKRGLGVAPMLTEVAQQTSEVVRLLPDMTPTQVPLWLVTHEMVQSSPGINLVERILIEELSSQRRKVGMH